MYNSRSHPLLAQIPLTVSPFISLPTATTLPYTYRPLPSTLPPSSTADPTTGTERENYVVSRSGHAASPEEIIASCQALQAHIQKTQEDAEEKVKEWEQSLKEQELAEKRRVAPGWLDRDEKILQPNRTSVAGMPKAQGPSHNIMDQQEEPQRQRHEVPGREDPAGDELDRAFGGMGLQNR
ncbi:hypothetical protein N7G274_006514 [Stereocaulon virgatum]|uniref:Uncharacterized protein n=1 Tax=Stereocaulon virgatum TaxID=373712 RepID=A0ABR4A3U9_9LECA